jgi:outer membrane lipoprotein-sorting protein
MSRVTVLRWAILALAPALAFGADGPAPAKLSAATIVERNVAARGGLAAWQAVHTLSWSGKLDAGGNNQRYFKTPGTPTPPPVKDPNAQVQLPFVMEMKRGRQSRLEIVFNGKTAVQVYDGTHGWKRRPFLNRNDIEPYTADELKTAADAADLDGLLIDYAAKGTKIDVEGMEPVEGKQAYKLKLTLKNNHVMHDWVDAQSFLEVKIEGTPRRLDGKLHTAAVFLRDYHKVDGLQIPFLMETIVQGVQRTEKIQIEKAVVNPRLDDSRFAKPS